MTLEPMDAREAALLSLIHAYGATVYVADLPGNVRGRYDHEAGCIYIQRGMSTAQRVSTLGHEAAHLRLGHLGPQDKGVEEHVDEEAAGLVITEMEYARAEAIVGGDARALAVELDVSPGLVEAWQRRRNREYHLPRTPDGHRLPL